MSGQFTITPDRSRNLLRVTMSGFFAPEDVARYAAAVATATASLPVPPASQAMICDISAMNIQAQHIVDAFRAFMADPRYAGRRVAFVVASTLARKQLSRIIAGRVTAMFATPAEAEAWLFEAAAAA